LNNDWWLLESLLLLESWLLVHLLLSKAWLAEILLLTVAGLSEILLRLNVLLLKLHLWLLVNLWLDVGLLSNNYLRSTIALAIHSDSHVGALTCAHHNNSMSLNFLSSEVDSTSWHALKPNLDILFVVVMVWSQ
jgi:hypothetical protein